jgi:two-component system, NarL family, sensor histidine kinase UhpB
VNALRHARAAHVMIDVSTSAGRMIISVTDDGVGLPEQWSRPGHFGLRGLAERVERLGGVLQVSNSEPHGVRLQAQIPLAEPA